MTDYEVHLRRYGGTMHGPMIIRLEAEDPMQAQRAVQRPVMKKLRISNHPVKIKYHSP